MVIVPALPCRQIESVWRCVLHPIASRTRKDMNSRSGRNRSAIEAHDEAGVFYGVCTLIQILEGS